MSSPPAAPSLSPRMSHPWPDYQLLDFGNGRKLERFGELVLDRPSPQASGKPRLDRAAWTAAAARFVGDKMGEGRWRKQGTAAAQTIEVPLPGEVAFRMTLDTLPTGQVGVFPEQFDNWHWIATQVARVATPVRVLNLFGYTGASTLAAAAVGAEVTHVDASKPSVATARSNAQLSGLGEHPIRWIVEDVVKYCRREVKRGQQYDAVILDPPTYGHGPGGEVWQLTRDLLPLLELCRELTRERRAFLLATSHTPSIGPAELSAYVSEGLLGHCGQPPATGHLHLTTSDGRQLESGIYARWPGARVA